MSFILEALRRAERERSLGRPTTLETVTQPVPAPAWRPRRAWPWLAAATFLLVAAAVSMALLRRSRPPPVPPVAAAPVPAPPAALPADEQAALIPAEDVMPEFLPEEAEPEFEETTTEPMGVPISRGRTLEPVDVQEAPAEEVEEAAPPPRPTEVETLKLEPAPQPGLKRFKDLPAQYRADFPKLTLDVHVYDAQPLLRWTMISGKRYREGENTVEGPRIAEIAREGIVFEHRGERFLYPLK